jgi:hypothetical protein
VVHFTFHASSGKHVSTETEAVNVETRGGYVTARAQLVIEMKEAAINMDSPVMITESGIPIGIMWASGISSRGYSVGIVQSIRSHG